MRKIILHVGMYKTGSTSIQNSLKDLKTSNVEYLNLPPVDRQLSHMSANHSLYLYTVFSELFDEFFLLKMLGLKYDDMLKKKVWCRNILENTLKKSQANTVIISAEAILDINVSGLVELKQMLLDWADLIEVYAYVRNPAGFISSATNNVIQQQFRDNYLHPLSYRGYFEKIENVFHEQPVNYRVFDKFLFVCGDVVHDFLEWCGLGACKFITRSSEENISLSTESIACLYALNNSKMPSYGERLLVMAREAVNDRLATMFTGKFSLPMELIQDTIDISDLKWMNERIYPKFDLPDNQYKHETDISLAGYLEQCGSRVLPRLTEEIQAMGGVVLGKPTLKQNMEQLYLEFLRNIGGEPYDYRRFNSEQYLEKNKDVAAAGVHAFGHYLLFGRSEGREAFWYPDI